MRPCQNGATCESVKGDYTCLCAPGYTGTHCKQGRSCHCHVVSSFLHQHVVLLLASLSSRVRLDMVTIICFFVISFLTFLSLRSPSTVSISYLLLLFSILLTLFPVFSFTAVLPLHSQSSSPPFSLSGYLISASFSSPILPICPAHFSLFLLKNSFTPTSTLSSSILLLSAPFTPTILIQLFTQTCTVFCFYTNILFIIHCAIKCARCFRQRCHLLSFHSPATTIVVSPNDHNLFSQYKHVYFHIMFTFYGNMWSFVDLWVGLLSWPVGLADFQCFEQLTA